MAILKHLASKSSNYGNVIRYLMFQHDAETRKPIIENGRLIMRDGILIDGLECDPGSFEIACENLNRQYNKNNTYSEIKSHHYIISFDPKDAANGLLTTEKAQEIGIKFAKANFPGHQAIVCTHPDGEHHSGNIHVHIVINSLRKNTVPQKPFMERRIDSLAGYKHHVTRQYLEYLKRDLMQICQTLGLHQLDITSRRDTLTSENFHHERAATDTVHSRYTPEPVAHTLTQKISPDSSPRKTTAIPVTDESASTVSPSPAPTEKSASPVTNKVSLLTELHKLQTASRALATIQEHGYKSLEALRADVASAYAQATRLQTQLAALDKTITNVNAQLHYTGQYYSNKKTYLAFIHIPKPHRAAYYSAHLTSLEKYKEARTWLQAHQDTGTLPTPKEIRSRLDTLLTQKQRLRSDYIAAKHKAQNMHTLLKTIEDYQRPEPPETQL